MSSAAIAVKNQQIIYSELIAVLIKLEALFSAEEARKKQNEKEENELLINLFTLQKEIINHF